MEICFLRENPRFCSITLQVDNSPIKHFLLKFDVTGINSGQVTNAKLCLYNVNSANEGGKFYRVTDNPWQEETITWNNAPAADTTLLASLGDVNPDTWYEVDLTSLITADGTHSLRVSDSVGGADCSSKEGANPPHGRLGSSPTPSYVSTSRRIMQFYCLRDIIMGTFKRYRCSVQES